MNASRWYQHRMRFSVRSMIYAVALLGPLCGFYGETLVAHVQGWFFGPTSPPGPRVEVVQPEQTVTAGMVNANGWAYCNFTLKNTGDTPLTYQCSRNT
ncbi:MAG: hypothetical protein N2C12_07220 [Planctomycetales bacterium]